MQIHKKTTVKRVLAMIDSPLFIPVVFDIVGLEYFLIRFLTRKNWVQSHLLSPRAVHSSAVSHFRLFLGIDRIVRMLLFCTPGEHYWWSIANDLPAKEERD